MSQMMMEALMMMKKVAVSGKLSQVQPRRRAKHNLIKENEIIFTHNRHMFINILRGLHPKEAEILILVKDGLLTDKYRLTKNIVAEAYPDIQWGGRS